MTPTATAAPVPKPPPPPPPPEPRRIVMTVTEAVLVGNASNSTRVRVTAAVKGDTEGMGVTWCCDTKDAPAPGTTATVTITPGGTP